MTNFIDAVLEPSLWFLADWSVRWAVLVVVLSLCERGCVSAPRFHRSRVAVSGR